MPTDDDLLSLPRTQTHKSDARSTVWQARTSAGRDIVIKRFEHSPIRQQLSRWLFVHPAQFEGRANARMLTQGIRVAPVIASGWQRSGIGCRAWLATEYVGPSLQARLRDGSLREAELRTVAASVAALVATLLAGGWYFRDLKTSNIVLADDSQPVLIDVGSARPLRSPRQREKMLAMLEETSLSDGMPADEWQQLRTMIDQPPGPSAPT